MKNNRLTHLLNILNTTEKRKLRYILETSAKEPEVLVLYDYLIKYAVKPKRLGKEQVFEEIYPKDATFNGRKLSDLNARLYHLAEDFVILRQLRKKDRTAQRQLLILEYLDGKVLPDNNQHADDLNHLTERTTKDLQNLLTRTDVHDLSYYLNVCRMNRHLYYFNTDKWQEVRQYMENLMENLDIFYCLTKLQCANELFMRERILNESSEVLLLDELYEYSAHLSKKGVYRADIYRLSLDLLKGFDEEKFYRLKEQIFEHADKFEKTELSHILILSANHIAEANRRGNANLVIANYEIYKLGLEKEVFIERGFISPLLLVNYALLCSELGKTDEIDEVLTQYQDRIKDSEKEDTFLLCRAYQHFGNGEFQDAFQLVNDHSRKSVSFGLHKKPLELKCLYELENLTSYVDTQRTLYDACAVYRRYLQRKSDVLNPSTYKANLNFVKILQKLGEPDTDKEELIQITAGESIVHRNWLIEKVKAKK